MGSAYSTKAELKTDANRLFLASGRRASQLFPLWPALSGSAAAEALFYCPFLFAPSLFLFPHLFSILSTSSSTFHLWPSLRSVCWPCLICWAIVAACGLLSVVLLGAGCWLWPSSYWLRCRCSHSRPLCSMCKLYNLSLAHLVTFKAHSGIILAFSY